MRFLSLDSVLSVLDPYVEGIGSIEFNITNQSFVVSGFTESEYWTQAH